MARKDVGDVAERGEEHRGSRLVVFTRFDALEPLADVAASEPRRGDEGDQRVAEIGTGEAVAHRDRADLGTGTLDDGRMAGEVHADEDRTLLRDAHRLRHQTPGYRLEAYVIPIVVRGGVCSRDRPDGERVGMERCPGGLPSGEEGRKRAVRHGMSSCAALSCSLVWCDGRGPPALSALGRTLSFRAGVTGPDRTGTTRWSGPPSPSPGSPSRSVGTAAHRAGTHRADRPGRSGPASGHRVRPVRP